MKPRNLLSRLSLATLIAISLLGISAQARITAGDITGGKKAPHVNIAIFHKLHGQESFTYPKSIKPQNILSAMQGKAQFISINHSAGLLDGDVVVVGNDVLREGANSHFADFGVDCQLTVHMQASAVELAGICEILMIDQDGREIEHKAIVKPTSIDTGTTWHLLYEDIEDGIAIYASAEIGLE